MVRVSKAWELKSESVMDTKGRLIAGSHNRNEFILINADEVARVSLLKNLSFSLFFPSLSLSLTLFFTPFPDFSFFSKRVGSEIAHCPFLLVVSGHEITIFSSFLGCFFFFILSLPGDL